MLALVQQVNQLRQQSLAFAWIDLVIVEAPCSQHHLGLIDFGDCFALAVVPDIVLSGLDHGLDHVHVVHFKPD